MPNRVSDTHQLLRNARPIIVVGFGLVLVAALALLIGLNQARKADALVQHSFEVERAAQGLFGSVKDAETGQRGFLLTGKDAYLSPLDDASKAIPGELQSLEQLTGDNPQQQARLKKLRPMIEDKLAELNRTVALNRQADHEAALAIVDTDQGANLMGGIRAGVADLSQAEGDLLIERQHHAETVRYVVASLIGIALLLATVLAAVLAISTRQATKSLLARTKELEEAEATLRQAHKMEAVGQLTGGVAHDFNNLLTIVIGNLDTIIRLLGSRTKNVQVRIQKAANAAMEGAQRAAVLTGHLLAFSRRQALEPKRLDLNRLLPGTLDMLRRTLGEDIKIEAVFGAGLWPTFADAHQIETTLLNLAINSKTAMPKGGCLTIETTNTYLDDTYARRFGDVAPGQYVLLSVTDTGTGIPKDILDRVFEPFFTTKPVGEGTGLGLAMVHGFVKQSGGHVRIYSEEGQGTTVKIYLPRFAQQNEVAAAPAQSGAAVTKIPKAKPSEVVLVVEDNDGVRNYAKDVLNELGYEVIEATDGDEALRKLEGKPRINLIFTDVVLPGSMNGRGLAEKMRELYPGVPILFTTGYTRNAIVHQGRLDVGVHLLNKPYAQQELARKVRSLLDAA
jgi:signal transduction histidine kinase